jgi:SAM-dependent MidA family methyltransferase
MNQLEQRIAEIIQKKGPVTFEKFMEMALYYPGMGYYSSPAATIGRAGDFFTSPHQHPIFGAMIGKQLVEMWEVMGSPPEFSAIEVGAGAGYLSKDILDYLCKPSEDPNTTDRKNSFLNSLRYSIVEPFFHFRKKQREILRDHMEPRRITWTSSLRETGGITGCIFSNELLDAFPVHLIETEDDIETGLKEICVGFDGKKFVEEKIEAPDEIMDYIKHFHIDLIPDYRTEVNLRIRDWLDEAASALAEGFILTIDYGYTAKEYYSEERPQGTLLCYYKHQYNENFYQHVGDQDMTAHVNFSSVKLWGDERGLKTLGYCPQGTFLAASGIDEVITELYAGSDDYFSEVSKIKTLILPQGMGESHSFMVQYKGKGSPDLRGFSLRNMLESL